MGIMLLLWLTMMPPAGVFFGWNNILYWLPASAATAIFLFLSIGVPVNYLARRRCADCYLALRRTMLEAGLDRNSTLEIAKGDCQRLIDAIDSRQRADIGLANERLFAAMGASLGRRERETAEIEATYPPRMAAIQAARDQVLQQADAKYPPPPRNGMPLPGPIGCLARGPPTGAGRQQSPIRTGVERNGPALERRRRAFRGSGGDHPPELPATLPRLQRGRCPVLGPPSEMPAAVRFGQITVQLAKIRGGIPDDPRLRPPAAEYNLPLLLPLPAHSLLLLKAGDTVRSLAVQSLQASMLRLLTSMPPGKVRFTIFDPVGLGENFSAFMHLADFDEQLVSSRIWTDSDHIEQRLADLTQHMENVIQVYLRNEFGSILDYNAFAGEMAEPYRILVIANFPANFTETAVQRLKSIVASGARCGVFVLLSVDSTLTPPHNVRVSDLDTGALLLRWEKGQFVWKHPEYGAAAVTLDAPPAPNDSLKSCGPWATRSATPAAWKCRSSASSPPKTPGGAATAAAASMCPWAAPGR